MANLFVSMKYKVVFNYNKAVDAPEKKEEKINKYLKKSTNLLLLKTRD